MFLSTATRIFCRPKSQGFPATSSAMKFLCCCTSEEKFKILLKPTISVPSSGSSLSSSGGNCRSVLCQTNASLEYARNRTSTQLRGFEQANAIFAQKNASALLHGQFQTTRTIHGSLRNSAHPMIWVTLRNGLKLLTPIFSRYGSCYSNCPQNQPQLPVAG